MKLQELFEANPANVISAWEKSNHTLRKIVEILNKNCSESITGNKIYRGMPKGIKASVIDTTNSKRFSKDTNNLYQAMMNESDKMKDFPSRSNSIIGALDLSTAITYTEGVGGEGGTVYVVIPFNGTKIAVTDNDDFVYSELSPLNVDFFDFSSHFMRALRSFNIYKTDNRIENLKPLNEALSKFNPFTIIFAYNSENPDSSLSLLNRDKNNEITIMLEDRGFDFYDDNKKIDELFNELDQSFIRKALTPNGTKLYEIFNSDKNQMLTALANYAMTPEKLGLRLMSPAGVAGRGEVWFSGKCVVIPSFDFKTRIKIDNGKWVLKK